VIARRDSELLRVSREHFEELLLEEPRFALALTRVLGSELRESRGLPKHAPPLPVTIAIVPLERELPCAALSERIFDRLLEWSRVVRLDGSELGDGRSDEGYGRLLDRCERENDRVLLVAREPPDGDRWTDFLLRQADRVLALTSVGRLPSWVERRTKLRNCDLIVCTGSPDASKLEDWLDALHPRLVHLVPRDGGLEQGAAGLARRLAGRSVGVVLSGGGARGFAHIGVLQELLDADITIDRVGGCSMGAFVGALFARGDEPEQIRARCRSEFVERNPLSDYTVPRVSLLRGRKALEMLGRAFGATPIEALPHEYFCVSCDLLSGELVVHRHGPLIDAVAASMSLPGVFAPLSRDGQLLVDGGVLNNLPVAPMATGEGPVIAVDVTARFALPVATGGAGTTTSRPSWAFRARKSKSAAPPLPGLRETLVRSIGIGSVAATEAARAGADLLIAPDTGAVGLLEFQKLDRMIEAGRRAARDALAASPEFPLIAK
jgi:predicted acylesterase/phospholipase RssA